MTDNYTYQYPSRRYMQFAGGGMVATSQPLAANAGLDAIKAGGNAIDAAIAAAAALTVVEPTSNGIGGDAFALVWIEAERRLYGLNASGAAPRAISIEAVRGRGHENMPKSGWIPVTTPGAPRGWADLAARFGKRTLAQNLQQAIDYARDGFPVSPIVAKYWGIGAAAYANRKTPEFAPWHNTFAPNGKTPAPGEIAKLLDHAATLAEIGKTNADSFYTGNIAKEIAKFAAEHGGFLTAEDLAAHENSWVEPISLNYRGYDIWEIPPNGQGIVALIALNALRGMDFTHRDDIKTHHAQIEAIKLAFAAAKNYVTDPAHMQIDPAEFLTDKYGEMIRAKINDRAQNPEIIKPTPGGTVYLAAADGEGNMVSYIQSNYMGFGSGIVIPGTGIAMQNRGADFSLDAAHANALAPGKRTYHTIIPAFVTQQNRAIASFGVMGGYMQPQGHVQMVMNMVDFGMNPQASLDAPRWQWMEGNNITIERAFPEHIAVGLSRLGHRVNVADSGSFGRGQIIRRTAEGVLCGGCEPRCDSAIACF